MVAGAFFAAGDILTTDPKSIDYACHILRDVAKSLDKKRKSL
jgi:hypothetical protein